MAFADLTIDEKYDLKAAYNEVRLAMEAATLTLNPATMARVEAAIAAIPAQPNTAVVDEFSQYDLLANLPPRAPLGVKLGLILNGTAITGFNLGGTGAYVQKNGQVALQNSAGAALGGNVTVGVDKSVATYVRLPATVAGVMTNTMIPVTGSAGTPSFSCAATVANGVVTGIKLPANIAMVGNGAMPVRATGTGTLVTATITAGAITALVLSA